tara:strand:+ start:10575 stop:10784 length:210 start_codon:yes stop_codon:yes gene_type:complete
MKVGDLVRIKPWCKNKGALAIVIGVPPWNGEVDIRYLDPADAVHSGRGRAKTANLTLVSEGKVAVENRG